jgi:hypothetical protein
VATYGALTDGERGEGLLLLARESGPRSAMMMISRAARAGGASSCRVKKKKNLNQKSASRAHALVPVRVASLCPAATSACARASHVMYY